MLPGIRKAIDSDQHKTNHRVKRYGAIAIASLILGLGLLVFGIYKVNQFFESNKFVFQSPIVAHLQAPIYITKREKVVTIVRKESADQNYNPLTPDQQYLCNKFGKDCRIALAIFRAESGLNKKALNVNKGGSVDFGCMQINSVHLQNIDTDKVNLFNCQNNIDVAYQIFQQQGNFSAWEAYTNGSYKKYLIN